MIRPSTAERSVRVFGAPGFRPELLKRRGDLSRARLRRYREEIEDLNDRQLLRRYMRYLRGAYRAQTGVRGASELKPCPFCGGEASPKGKITYPERHRREQG